MFLIMYRDLQFTILSQLLSMVLLISYWWQNTLNAHLVALLTAFIILKLFPSLSVSKPIIWFFYFIALLFLLSFSDTLDHIYKNPTTVHTQLYTLVTPYFHDSIFSKWVTIKFKCPSFSRLRASEIFTYRCFPLNDKIITALDRSNFGIKKKMGNAFKVWENDFQLRNFNLNQLLNKNG